MKAFYIIHISVILETVLAIFITIKISDFILKIKKLELKIQNDSKLKLVKIKEFRERIESFNQKYEQRFTYTLDLLKRFAIDILLNGITKKYLPKISFLPKLGNYKITIACFLVSFFVFRNKKA